MERRNIIAPPDLMLFQDRREPGGHAATLERLRGLPVSRVYPGHYGAFGRARMLALIDEQLADLEDRRREKCP